MVGETKTMENTFKVHKFRYYGNCKEPLLMMSATCRIGGWFTKVNQIFHQTARSHLPQPFCQPVIVKTQMAFNFFLPSK